MLTFLLKYSNANIITVFSRITNYDEITKVLFNIKNMGLGSGIGCDYAQDWR